MVLYPNKLPESERVCSGICTYGNELFTIFAQAFRGNDIVGKLQGKCLDTRRIANSTKVQTRHRGQPISSGLLICVFVQAFGDAFEYAQVAVPLSLYIT